MNPQDIETIRRILREELKALLPLLDLPSPLPVADNASRLIALARVDRAASIAEAKRLAREDSLRIREEKKRRKAA